MSVQPPSPLLDPASPILIVDGQTITVDLISRIVKSLGYANVDGTSDGLTALWMAAQKKYGLIMTEMAMAPVSGLDILNTIRADRLLKATKVMMMTGEGRPGDEAKARAAGANGFIVKPFQREALQQAIADLT
jgi:CheY-like chemotaxis protein